MENTALEASKFVDLDVEYSPVVISSANLLPKRCVKLENGKYGIYDAGIFANLGDHWWNVGSEQIKIFRAQYLLQRNTFYEDLVYKAVYPRGFSFRHYSGANINKSALEIECKLIPLYFPDSVFVPGENNPLSRHILSNYKVADKFIEIIF
jgi:hypothetical protein